MNAEDLLVEIAKGLKLCADSLAKAQAKGDNDQLLALFAFTSGVAVGTLWKIYGERPEIKAELTAEEAGAA